jgi:hypothetical protein
MNIAYVSNFTLKSFRRLHAAVPRRLQAYQPSTALLFYNTANLKDEESKLVHPEQKFSSHSDRTLSLQNKFDIIMITATHI